MWSLKFKCDPILNVVYCYSFEWIKKSFAFLHWMLIIIIRVYDNLRCKLQHRVTHALNHWSDVTDRLQVKNIWIITKAWFLKYLLQVRLMYMYEIVSWPLLVTAALCFTTQGCVLPAPGWPMAPNYCSGATRNLF